MNQTILFPPQSTWKPDPSYPSLDGVGRISVDLETCDPQLLELGPGVRRGGHIVGVALGTDYGLREYMPVAHEGGGNLDKEIVFDYCSKEFWNYEGEVCGANLSYDLDYLAEQGIEFNPQRATFLDVQVAEPLLDENKFIYSLDSLGSQYLNEPKREDLLKEAATAWGLDPKKELYKLHSKYVGAYAEGDVDLPLRIIEKQLPLLEEQNLMELFRMESKLIPILLRMRRRGVKVDLEAAQKLMWQLTKRKNEFIKEVHTLGSSKIEISKPETFGAILEKQGFDVPKTPKTKKYSITDDWMEARSHIKLIYNIAQARKVNTLINTFLKGTIFGHQIKGRIHCEFNQLKRDDPSGKGKKKGTIARFSSSNPNLQNIPTRTAQGKEIRKLFLPEEGEDYDKHDWSQIEYRFLTHFAIGKGAEEARQQYKDDPKTDFHEMTRTMAGAVNPLMLEKQRGQIKNGNFGIVYGSGVAQTGVTMGLSYDEAKEFMDMYEVTLPFVTATRNAAMGRAKDRGYVMTIMGRRGRFDLWEPRAYGMKEKPLPYDRAIEEYGQRIQRAGTFKGLSRVLQGSAADLMKLAMVEIADSGIESVVGPSLLTVHDELGNSTPHTKEGEEAMMEQKHIMENCMVLKVPIIAERETGPSWGEVKKTT